MVVVVVYDVVGCKVVDGEVVATAVVELVATAVVELGEPQAARRSVANNPASTTPIRLGTAPVNHSARGCAHAGIAAVSPY